MTETAVTMATNNLPSDLNLLTTEIKFYINQWGQNTIEIGKRLIAAKEIVGHGNFGKWLEENFNLKQRMANNFMACAKRFANSQSIANLNPTQMFQLLALPEGEEEKFIAEQAANGNPVEDMHVSELKAKVAEYKAELEKKNSEVTDLFAENKKLQEDKNGLSQIVKDSNNQIKELANEKGQLEKANLDLKNQLKNQKPTEKYHYRLNRYSNLNSQFGSFQNRKRFRIFYLRCETDFFTLASLDCQRQFGQVVIKRDTL